MSDNNNNNNNNNNKKRKDSENSDGPKKKKLKASHQADEDELSERDDNEQSEHSHEEKSVEEVEPKDGSILVVDHATGRRFAVLLKLTPMKAKIQWLQWKHDGAGFATYTRSKSENSIFRRNIVTTLPTIINPADNSVQIKSSLVHEHITSAGSQLPPPTTNHASKKNKAFEIDLSLPIDLPTDGATSRKCQHLCSFGNNMHLVNIQTLDLLGFSYKDCWFGDSDIECSWNFMSWLNAFGYLDKDKGAKKSSNGKSSTDAYLYFRLLMYVLASSSAESATDNVKKQILSPFNEKADPEKYIVYYKRFHLATLLQYTKLVPNTWKTAVQKLKEAGVVWLEENEHYKDNCVHIIIPPIKPTEKIKQQHTEK